MIAEVIFEPQKELVQMICTWVGLCAFFVWLQSRRSYGGAGFVFIYILLLSVIHLFGAIIHSVPQFARTGVELVVLGFRESLWGLAAYCAGAFLPILGRATLDDLRGVEPKVPVPAEKIRFLMTLGVGFFLVRGILGRVPSIGASINAGTNLIVVAMVLGLWNSWIGGKKTQMLLWVLLCAGFPIFTLAFQGFLGFGATAAAVVLLCAASFYRPQWRVWVIGLPSLYFALSLFVTYMRDRTDIREQVWGGSKMERRIESMRKIVDEFEWLNLANENHLDRIEDRLNQNILVGKTVARIENGTILPVQGLTLWWAIQSLVPRIIWWGKTVKAGSMNSAGYFTGDVYASGTSVGLGQVMEFYGNFKRTGVIVCFFLLGWLVAFWDMRCGVALRRGDWRGYAYYFILLVPLMTPGGSAVELFSGTAAAAVLVWFLKNYLFKDKKEEAAENKKKQGNRIPPKESTAVPQRPERFVLGETEAAKEEDGPTPLQASPTREELRRVENGVEPEAASEKHARPTRYVYGKKKD